MPKKGDKFQTNTYQNWGEYNPKRISHSRHPEQDEAYITIPKQFAKQFDIRMSNDPDANTDYKAHDSKGNLICTLKAQGCSTKGDVFAKQFAGNGDLSALRSWILENKVNDNDTIEELINNFV
jgi:hypothetical protein